MSIYTAAILSDSPVAYWRLGDLTGTSAADASGNGHAGTYSGGVALGRAGAVAGTNDAAVLFDGTSGQVTCGHPTAFDLTSNFSLECWFQAVALPPSSGNGRWFLGKDVAGGRSYDFGLLNNAGTIDQCVQINGTSYYGATVTLDGLWHHTVATYASSTLRFYLDGIAGPTASASTPPAVTTTDLLIGARGYSGFQEFFNGTLDEVALYSAALSAARITAHYNAGLAQGLAAPAIGPMLIRRAMR